MPDQPSQDNDLLAAVERCREGKGSLEDYRAAFEFADDAVMGLRQRLKRAFLTILSRPDPSIKKVEQWLRGKAAEERAIADRCPPGSMGALAERARGRAFEEAAEKIASGDLDA